METKTGVIITNLGTPDTPTPAAIRKFLGEFLRDRDVVNLPPLIWWPLLYGIILPLRPLKLVEGYQEIWQEEGSPLLVHSQKLTNNIQLQLQKYYGEGIYCALAMRYGNPSIKQALDQLKDKNVDKLVILPLYPQYSETTSGSSFKAITKELKKWTNMPEISFVRNYSTNKLYIKSIANSIEQHWQEHGRAKKLILSFHGLPKKLIDNGDPYLAQCQDTAKLISETLQLTDEHWQLTFQSRVGRSEWLKPYTAETLKNLAQTGTDSIDIICPGFAADCLETLEEIAITNRDVFLQAGGKELRYIPALNDSASHVLLLADLIGNSLG